ncbi:phosphopantetheine-binding protein [Cytobacillus oceanisediminis]|uniref:phosphopantetheine-binding protein n=1 Tax=Cytobacillus oceanisediminis TaxID=665099 RepID=UPI001C23BE97|nr:phosphopantetheine-binding protein [Cytobacillus oceanisediminis]MBU8772070.1 hypothetical protein [Cytobacillus oceanisediminis]
MNKNEFFEKISEILGNSLKGASEEDDLIQLGILNSFKVTEILMYIEEWTQSELIMEDLEIESVKSINNLYSLYLKYLKSEN